MIGRRTPTHRADWKTPQELGLSSGSPFALGLLAALPMRAGAGAPYDLVHGVRAVTAGATSTHRRGDAGRRWSFSAASTSFLNFTAAPFSVFAFLRVTGVIRPLVNRRGALCRAVYVSTSDNQGWILGGGVSSGAKWLFARFANNATGHLYSTTARVADTDYAIAGTTDGTTSRIYVGGVAEANTTNNPAPVSASAAFENLFLTQTALDEDHEIYVAYVWNRCLDPAEIRELSASPYLLLRPAAVPPAIFSFPQLDALSSRPPRTVEQDAAAEEAAIAGATAAYPVLEIRDDAGVYTDFSGRIAGEARHAWRFGDVTHDSERQPGIYQTNTISVEMDNRDGFWSFAASSTATDPNGTEHTFSGFYRRRVRIGRQVVGPGTGFVYQPLAVMMVDAIRVSTTSPTATLSLVPLAKLLQEAAAEPVKDGEDWYRSRPIGWLVRALVEHVMPDITYESGSPPAKIAIATHDSTQQHSTFGQVPGWNGSYWYDLGYIVRCVAWDGADTLYVGFETRPGDPFAATNGGAIYAYTISTDTWTPVTNGAYALPVQYLAYRSGALFVVCWRPALAGTTQEKCVDANVYRHSLTSPYTVTTLATGDQLWPCGWFYRKGNPDLGAYWIGETGSGCENDPIPVAYENALRTHVTGGYYVRYPNVYATASFGSLSSTRADGTTSYPVSGTGIGTGWEAGVSRGFAHLKAASLPTVDMRVRAHWRHLSDTAKVGRTDGRYLYWITWNGTVFRFNRVDMATSPYTRAVVSIPFAGVTDTMVERQIVSWAVNDDASYLYASCIDWDEETIGSKATSYLVRWTINNATFGLSGESNRWSELESAAPVKTRTLLDLVAYGTSTVHVTGCALDRRNVLGAPYGVFCLEDAGPTMTISQAGWPASQAPYSGFCYFGGYWFFADTASGAWYRKLVASRTSAVDLMASGRPHIDGSPSLSAWPIGIATGISAILGFSAPSSPPWQHARPADHASGIAWMFSLSSALTDRVVLADFSGLKVWDALSMLARMAGDYEMGINEGGAFYFRARSTATPTATLRTYGPHGTLGSGYVYFPCEALEVEPDYGSVYNVIGVTPYVARYSPPEATFERTVESRYNARDRITHLVSQIGTRKQQLILSCVRRGTINQGVTPATVTTARAPIFRVIPYRQIVETGLIASLPAGGTILTVGNTEGVEKLDTIVVNDSAIRTVVAVDATARQITISSTFGVISYPIGARIRVFKQGHGLASDNTAGIATVQATMTASAGDTVCRVSSVARIGPQTILRVGAEEFLVTALTEIAGSTDWNLTVVRGANGTVIETHAAADVVLGYWSPREYDGIYPVEASGISIQIRADAVATHEESSVLEGDRIVVTCPGLSLEAVESSRSVVVSTVSRGLYGPREYPAYENRFLGYVYADAVAKRLRDLYYQPRLKITATAALLDTLTYGLGARLYVEDRRLLRRFSGSYVQATVTGYSYSGTTGKARYKLRSEESVT